MNRTEKTNRRARNAIITYLVASEQPKTEQEALTSWDEWEQLPLPKLIEAKNYTIQRNKYVNPTLTWFMNICLQDALKAKENVS